MSRDDSDVNGKPTSTRARRCSVVIRCFNEAKHIGRLLDGVMQQTLKDVEIIVVDSGSTDGTTTIVQEFPVKLLEISPENFSFGRSLNIGFSAARGEILVAVSAHTYPVHKDWLEQLIAPFADEEVALVYGKQRGNHLTKYSEHQVFKNLFGEESNWDQAHPFCNNANAAVRRAVFERLRYNEELSGLEDLDWSRRAMTEGWKIAYAADAEIVHVHEETRAQVLNRYRREAMAMKTVYPGAHFGVTDLIRLTVTNVLSDLYQAAFDRVLFRNFPDILMFRAMQFWGTYQGYNRSSVLTRELRQRFYYPNAVKRRGHRVGESDRHRIDYAAIEHKKDFGA